MAYMWLICAKLIVTKKARLGGQLRKAELVHFQTFPDGKVLIKSLELGSPTFAIGNISDISTSDYSQMPFLTLTLPNVQV